MAGLDTDLVAEVDESYVIGPLGISSNHLDKLRSLPECLSLDIRFGNERGLLAKRTEDFNMITLNFTALRLEDGLPSKFLSFFYCETPLMFRVLQGTIEEARDFLDKIDLSSFKG